MAVEGAVDEVPAEQPWLGRGVVGIGGASLLADLGHEIPTALLPSLLTSTLGAPASALGLIEGVSDALAGAARFAGGPLADDPHRRRSAAVGGYAATAVLSGLVGVATSVWQVGVLRAGAWAARGLRVPSRNALLADVVAPGQYGRAYGFERAMDNLGAIGGPLLALALIAVFSVRTAILLSIIPGLLAVLAILYAIRQIPKPTERERQSLKFKVRPVLQGRLGRFLGGVTLFEAANMAATLMILRASKDLRRARAASMSLIPTTTGSATAIGLIFPELQGRLDGHAVRVPLLNASLTDCVFELERETTVDEMNSLFRSAAEGPLAGILGYEERPLVSVDYVNDSRSSIVDALSTMVVAGTQAKVYAWYDNEWGYANRLVELAGIVARGLESR